MRKNLPNLKMFTLATLFAGSVFAQNGPVPELFHYKFDGTGTKVPNFASNKPAGTDTANIIGNISKGPSIVLCGGALIGSGSPSNANYLNTGWAPNRANRPWTISFRSSEINLPTSTLYYVFGDVNTTGFRCFTNGVAGPNNFILRGAGITDIIATGSAQPTPTMTTFVFDSAQGHIRAYVNGVLVSTVNQTVSAINLTGVGPFKVMGYGSNVGAPAGGLMDDFRMYDRALTTAEVLAIYTPTISPSGFLGSDIISCTGSAIIDANAALSHNPIWSNGATTSSITITNSGTYTLLDSSICGVRKDTVMAMIGNTNSTSQTLNLCAGQSITIDGNTYTTSGVYTDTLTNTIGCDSIVTTNLTVAAPIASSQSINRCFGQSFFFNGNTYTTSGIYTDTLTAANGCDSIVTTNLTVAAPITSSQTINRCFGQSFTFNGNTYTTSGVYADTLTAANGCDSIVTTNLTVATLITSSQNINRCFGQSFTFNGNTYTTSGIYADTLTAANGCDSIVTTNLTVAAQITSSQNINLCNGQSFTINGNTYTTNGVYIDTLTSVNGCDSIVTTNLAISPAITSTVSASICQGQTYTLNGVSYNSTGSYLDTLTAANGCDSIITLNLTVNAPVNIGTSVNNLTITATAVGATYQWINCTTNTNIASATSQSYTATANGSYAVIVTQNGCTDTSACVNITTIGINNVIANTITSIYPNPSNGKFIISTNLNSEINIYDALGREILKQTINSGKNTIDLSKEFTGVYFVKIKNAQGQTTNRIVINK